MLNRSDALNQSAIGVAEGMAKVNGHASLRFFEAAASDPADAPGMKKVYDAMVAAEIDIARRQRQG